ncbi:hypothetical protein FGL85_07655 [Leuconostoc pseudomesenteroides]|jgi:hypothetical protein|uniref:Uncharacterized protein n=1 Tax=Leuconostoc pseudomesenteroides TaxID=33968 RepID=A0A5B8T0C1_LEUPS|nr:MULTISPECIES: hypothetical protein [Leuconostoc]MBK0041635.1 hypothetical protein [Leuconostoc sp. S51]MBK0052563.1 hypothetical protein [Leuconostoc sp. S50]MBS0958901.1 hypothetical protein [Leuconostoc pseudomesenteroides]MCT4380351.1 hypothetical protein [Leuconostoc pseudomesenteroides]QEA42386.1 hypothetical protein FGL85_07655 [Leuconostoc pseudomesenteroides]
MYKAVGWHSRNEYMTGNSLADVMRKLQKEYPAPRRTSRGMSTRHIYSEPLRIIDETGKDKQYLP